MQKLKDALEKKGFSLKKSPYPTWSDDVKDIFSKKDATYLVTFNGRPFAWIDMLHLIDFENNNDQPFYAHVHFAIPTTDSMSDDILIHERFNAEDSKKISMFIAETFRSIILNKKKRGVKCKN